MSEGLFFPFTCSFFFFFLWFPMSAPLVRFDLEVFGAVGLLIFLLPWFYADFVGEFFDAGCHPLIDALFFLVSSFSVG